MKPFVKRSLMSLAAALVLLAAVAVYLLHAPEPAPPPGRVELVTVEFDGLLRNYSIVAPSRPLPGAGALLVFHRSQGSGAEMRRIVGHALERLGAQANFIVVYPDGIEGHFNDCRREASYSARTLDVDDVGFAKHVVGRLVASRAVDPERVYALGFSNGGHMAIRLALEAPDLVDGIAAIGANLPAPDNMACEPVSSSPRRVVIVAGTEDPINPYEGGPVTLFGFGNRGKVLSARASAEWFAGRLGLTQARDAAGEQASGLAARRQDWMSSDAHVRLVTIEGGGHTIPQAAYRFPRIFGATYASDSVLKSVWELFEENG